MQLSHADTEKLGRTWPGANEALIVGHSDEVFIPDRVARLNAY
jgi:hypothetical protein